MVRCTGNFCSFKEVVPCFQDAVVALGAIFCGLCGVNVGTVQGGLQGGGVPQVIAVPLRAPAGGVGNGWDQLAELAVTSTLRTVSRIWARARSKCPATFGLVAGLEWKKSC